MTASSLSPGLDPRDRVLARLSAELRGPRRLRADLLAELRDGLDDATDDLLASGLDVDEARLRAIEEFGDPVALANELQAELTGAQARRTALAVALVSLLVGAAWAQGYPAMMRTVWMSGGHPLDSPLLEWLSIAQERAVWIMAPLLLLAYGAILRRTVALRRAALVIGLLAVGLLTINIGTSSLMMALNPPLIDALQRSPSGWLLTVGTVAPMLFLVGSTVRVVRLLAFQARPIPRRE